MATATQTKWVYAFEEGSRDMRELLGGKGANVAEMTRILGAERVPAGFTITTEACVAYMNADRQEPEGLDDQVSDALSRLEEHTGKRLGDPDDPLLVSVRSGARESMPGMMDTILNLGLNDESVEGVARATGNEWFAWDSYRRFVQMFGNVARDVPGEAIEDAIKEQKQKAGVKLDTELSVDDLKALVEKFKELYRDQTGEDFPQQPRDQLDKAVRAVFDSWMGERAVSYRRINRLPDDWGTAVNVQQMVFGNKGDDCCTGVAFSRDERTGEPDPSGDFLVNAQGEDVVSGVRTPRDLNASPGAAKGEIVFTAEDAVDAAADGRRVVLVRPFTEADDVSGFHAAQGILTSEGGKASHAALVARGMGKPCVAGASALEIDVAAAEVRVDGTVLHAGDRISIDGTAGIVTTADVPLEEPT